MGGAREKKENLLGDSQVTSDTFQERKEPKAEEKIFFNILNQYKTLDEKTEQYYDRLELKGRDKGIFSKMSSALFSKNYKEQITELASFRSTVTELGIAVKEMKDDITVEKLDNALDKVYDCGAKLIQWRDSIVSPNKKGTKNDFTNEAASLISNIETNLKIYRNNMMKGKGPQQ